MVTYFPPISGHSTYINAWPITVPTGDDEANNKKNQQKKEEERGRKPLLWTEGIGVEDDDAVGQ